MRTIPLPMVAVPTCVVVVVDVVAAEVLLTVCFGNCLFTFSSPSPPSPTFPSSPSPSPVSGLGESSGSSGSEGCFLGSPPTRLDIPAFRLSNCFDLVTAMMLSLSRDLCGSAGSDCCFCNLFLISTLA